jgi:hypothetical protein
MGKAARARPKTKKPPGFPTGGFFRFGSCRWIVLRALPSLAAGGAGEPKVKAEEEGGAGGSHGSDVSQRHL